MGKETCTQTGAACLLDRNVKGVDIAEVALTSQSSKLNLQKHHNLMIYFYDNKHAQFPSYITENAPNHSPTEFRLMEAKAMAFILVTFLPASKINALCCSDTKVNYYNLTTFVRSKSECHQ